jgi:hypothetical protein
LFLFFFANRRAALVNTALGLFNEKLSPKEKFDLLFEMARLLTVLSESDFETLPVEHLVGSARQFLSSPSRSLRAAALRTLRHLQRIPRALDAMLKMKVPLFVAQSLRTPHDDERLQALLWVREFFSHNCDRLPLVVLRTLVSIVESKNDKITRACLECLCEICVRAPQLVASIGAFRTLFSCIVDPMFIGYASHPPPPTPYCPQLVADQFRFTGRVGDGCFVCFEPARHAHACPLSRCSTRAQPAA